MIRKNHNRIDPLSIIVFVYLFLLFMFPERTKIISIAIIVISGFYLFMNQRAFTITHQGVSWIFYVLYSVASILYNNIAFGDGFALCAAIIIGLIFYFCNNKNNSQSTRIKALVLVSLVAFSGCVFQMMFPDALKEFNLLHLGHEKYESFDEFYRGGFIVGFSYQTAVTGFYLSILVCTIFCSMLSNYLKLTRAKIFIRLFLLVTSYIFLFFTGKRIFIIVTVVSVLSVYCIFNQRHILKMLIVSLTVFFGVYLLLHNTDSGLKLLERSSGQEWSTGRTKIYQAMIENFWANPLFGKGVGSSLHALSGYTNGHNIYLQILSESGIVGFVVLVPIFLHDLYLAIYLLGQKIKKGENTFYLSTCVAVEILFIGWGFTGNPLYDVYPLVIYMFVAGIVRDEIDVINKI